jgi:zinc/manganese transport system ATP-binding protein
LVKLQLETVGVRFGDTWALRDVSTTFVDGRHSVVVGPNGAGKSTLLDVVCGFRRPDSGRVTGVAVAYVPQHRAISDRLPLSVVDAVTMGRWRHARRRPVSRRDRAIVAAAMERVGVADLARRQVAELSGGQRQRVLLAQALAQQANVLLLDEPTAAVDASGRSDIAGIVADEVARGCAVVDVTHDLVAARDADHCLLLSRGAVVAQGAPRDVLTGERITDVWGSGAGVGATMTG